jgi:hypothetical protein
MFVSVNSASFPMTSSNLKLQSVLHSESAHIECCCDGDVVAVYLMPSSCHTGKGIHAAAKWLPLRCGDHLALSILPLHRRHSNISIRANRDQFTHILHIITAQIKRWTDGQISNQTSALRNIS